MKQESMLNSFQVNPNCVTFWMKWRNGISWIWTTSVSRLSCVWTAQMTRLMICEWTRPCAEPLRVSALGLLFEALEMFWKIEMNNWTCPLIASWKCKTCKINLRGVFQDKGPRFPCCSWVFTDVPRQSWRAVMEVKLGVKFGWNIWLNLWLALNSSKWTKFPCTEILTCRDLTK